jgi:hypothetical protein
VRHYPAIDMILHRPLFLLTLAVTMIAYHRTNDVHYVRWPGCKAGAAMGNILVRLMRCGGVEVEVEEDIDEESRLSR